MFSYHNAKIPQDLSFPRSLCFHAMTNLVDGMINMNLAKECNEVKNIILFALLFVSLLSLVGCGNESASIGIIGGADGPTAVFVTSGTNWGNIYGLLGVIVVTILVVFVIYRNKKKK